MNNKEILLKDLTSLGIKKSDTLLVHSSMKGLNTNDLTVNDVIDTLLLAVSEGTLLVPALSYLTVTPKNSNFNVETTETCIGILPEVFRKEYATHRSIHPTHSVCAKGKLASQITSSHKLDNTPVGEHSPFRLLEKVGGKILMLGCSLKYNTFMHGVEEVANASYPLSKEMIQYTIMDKSMTYKKSYYPHDFNNLIQRYDRLENLLSEPDLIKGPVLNGIAYLIDAQAAMKVSINAINKSDHYFIDEI